jgi:glycerophosphoryl diester phosphodiesterase
VAPGVDRRPSAPDRRVAVSAHRGGSERALAGTVAAYEDALAAGADYVEFDVQRTRDGELIVYHDRRAERRGFYPAQVSRIDLDAMLGYEVPDVADLLAMIAGRAKAHIDVKQPGYESEIVAQAIGALGPENVVVTGNDEVVRAVKDHFPGVRAALSLGRGQHEIPMSQMMATRWSEVSPLRRVRACGADAVAMHYRLARLGVLATCARHGIGAMIWTVNEPAMIRSYLADPRVDVLITDRPRLALRLRDGEQEVA